MKTSGKPVYVMAITPSWSAFIMFLISSLFMLVMLPLSLSFCSLVQILAKLLNPSLVATSDLGWGFSLLCVCVNGTSRDALLCVSSSESYNRAIQLV